MIAEGRAGCVCSSPGPCERRVSGRWSLCSGVPLCLCGVLYTPPLLSSRLLRLWLYRALGTLALLKSTARMIMAATERAVDRASLRHHGLAFDSSSTRLRRRGGPLRWPLVDVLEVLEEEEAWACAAASLRTCWGEGRRLGEGRGRLSMQCVSVSVKEYVWCFF